MNKYTSTNFLIKNFILFSNKYIIIFFFLVEHYTIKIIVLRNHLLQKGY